MNCIQFKAKIKDLLEAVEKAAKEAPAENKADAENMVKHSQRLADDAVSDKPDEEDVQFS